jgi:hypothetical protein
LPAQGEISVNILGNLLRPFFGVPDELTAFREEDKGAGLRLKTVVDTVTQGCQLTLQHPRFQTLVGQLNTFDEELLGFAYEGAGVGLAALDCCLPWGNRVRAFLDGPGSGQYYAVYLGVGMGLARLRRKPEQFLKRLDPVLGWLILDGYGFHEGFFSARRALNEQLVPRYLSPFGRRVFDHGLGRSIWFTSGTNGRRVTELISTFPESRRADLWSGVGLACSYTGGAERAVIQAVRELAGAYAPHLAMGAAIAADARHTGGIPSHYVEMACEILCGTSSKVASDMVQDARQNLSPVESEPVYQIWRQRLVDAFATQPTEGASR